ncbi:MAG TPA: BrnT family toxin [Caulobacteraceae bacterium]|nr:BrnT family toxin [Caulobacteraceae bacterium]
MKITYDPAKRAATLRERGIDFKEAADVFAGTVVDTLDERFEYGEVRTVTFGYWHGRIVVVVWTQRGEARHVISMRKANAREQARFGKRLSEI